jgi:hypothetical protein
MIPVSIFLLLATCSAAIAQQFAAPKSLGPVETYGKHLGRSMRLLQESTAESPNTVRILFYGQSITEQKWSRLVADELRRRYPHAKLIIENRAIGGHSSQLLVKTAEADLYPFYPDLVIFHVYGDHRRYEDIIRRIRERTTADVLLQNDHLSADQSADEEVDPQKLSPAQWSQWFNNAFLPDLATRYQVELANQRGIWKQYLKDHALAPSDLLSDNVHLNSHGEFLMAEIVNAHLRLHPDAPQTTDRVTTWKLGEDVEWTDNQLTLQFDGNKIDAIFGPAAKSTFEVRIDGKRPSTFNSCHAFSRASHWPNSNWPMLLQVHRGETPLQLETWTLSLTEISEDHSVFNFSLTGSLTGPDGSGNSGESFRSKSGRIAIEPDDWNLAFAHKVFGQVLPEGTKVTFEVLPMFADTVEFDGLPTTIVLAQGLPPGPHTLQISGQSTSALTALKAHHPPEKSSADRP